MSRLAKLTSLLSTSPIKAFDANQLRRLAKLTGANASTGTKGELASSILSAIGSVTSNQDGCSSSRISTRSVLSIDMGVANLAYCKLDLPPVAGSGSVSGPEDRRIPPTVQEWNRISVLENIPKVKQSDSSHADANTQNASSKYTTSALAIAATRLVNDLVLSRPKASQPAHILIERQRWRTLGGSGVLEWTIRVNTLEAMLWAILESAREQRLWTGQVHSIEPRRVADWWFDGDDSGDGENSKQKKGKRSTPTTTDDRPSILSAGQKYKALKSAKTALVSGMLDPEDHSTQRQVVDMTSISGSSSAILAAFLQSRKQNPKPNLKPSSKLKRKSSGTTKKEEDTGIDHESEFDLEPGLSSIGNKLDDLADCMLQGIAFARWMENRRLLAETGLDGVKELLGDSD